MDVQTFAEAIYRLPPPPPRPRPSDKPMQVLALGLGRSGTDSLRAALEELGYAWPYHGWHTAGDPGARDARIWCRLLQRKYFHTKRDGADCKISAEEFDVLLGASEAVTDMPCAVFARELIAAYPEAKVILNIRPDVDKWYQSLITAFIPIEQSWAHWYQSWFVADAFWNRRMWFDMAFVYFYHGNIVRTAKWRWEEHNAMVRGLVPKDRLLEWTVGDGWGPLCQFLEKPMPVSPFPSGNTVSELKARIRGLHTAQSAAANRNAMTCLGIIVAAAGGLYLLLSQ